MWASIDICKSFIFSTKQPTFRRCYISYSTPFQPIWHLHFSYIYVWANEQVPCYRFWRGRGDACSMWNDKSCIPIPLLSLIEKHYKNVLPRRYAGILISEIKYLEKNFELQICERKSQKSHALYVYWHVKVAALWLNFDILRKSRVILHKLLKKFTAP